MNSIAPLIVVDCFIITTIYQDSNLTLHYMPEHVFWKQAEETIDCNYFNTLFNVLIVESLFNWRNLLFVQFWKSTEAAIFSKMGVTPIVPIAPHYTSERSRRWKFFISQVYIQTVRLNQLNYTVPQEKYVYELNIVIFNEITSKILKTQLASFQVTVEQLIITLRDVIQDGGLGKQQLFFVNWHSLNY